MKKTFEMLDQQPTRLGEISLRRRNILSLGGLEVFEVKLGEEFLMSSLFHDVEVALADLGLAAVRSAQNTVGNEVDRPALDVVVGGLGLGYTAVAALRDPRVRSLIVIETLEAVIGWHRKGMVPLGPVLSSDTRCRLVNGDFFKLAAAPETGFDPDTPARRFDAILLDIDHSPTELLSMNHEGFYQREGLERLREHLRPGGVFALWSDDPPSEDFMAKLDSVFEGCQTHVVNFPNPILGTESASTVYVGRAAGK